MDDRLTLKPERRLVQVIGEHSATGFADLLQRLIDDVMRLLDQKLALLMLELRDQLASAGRNAGMLAVGGVVAGLGVFLLGIALALFIGSLIGSEPGGFAIVGTGLALAGGGLLAAMVGRLRRQRFVPKKTVQELKRDVTWIKNEL